jgi:hypothetical protein
LLWKVLDNSVVDACLVPFLIAGAMTVAAVLLPDESGLKGAAVSIALFAGLLVIGRLIGALFSRG